MKRACTIFLALILIFNSISLAVLGSEAINLAPNAAVGSSFTSDWENLYAIQKQDTPESSAAATGDQYGNYNHAGNDKTNWVEYTFEETQRIEASRVYWFADHEGIVTPEQAVLEYYDGSGWVELADVSTEENCFNENSFAPVETKRIRLVMTGQGTYATGIKRWQIMGYEIGDNIGLDDSLARVEASISVNVPDAAATFTFQVTNVSESDFAAKAVLELYDGEGSAVAQEETEFTAQTGAPYEGTVTIEVPQDNVGDVLTVKGTLWTGENYATPFAEEVTASYAPISDHGSAFSGTEVQLTDGLFKDSQELGAEYLLSLDIDRLCASLYKYSAKVKNGQLQMPAEVYWGWENSGDRGLNGHSVGHYLSACAEMYQQTGNEEFVRRMDRAVELIAAAQDDDGFVGGFDRQFLDAVFEDPEHIDSGGFNDGFLGGIWAPWYSVHKILQGVIDVYTVTGNQRALDIAEGIASYAKMQTDKLNDAQMEVMLVGEHGGINESFANLYEVTGKTEYIELAKRFTQKAILDPLAAGVDNLSGLHANTQIPKLVGAAKIYLLTGDDYYRRAAEFFWKNVVENRTYANGGNSDNEHFTEIGTEPLSTTSTETCNSYNMLKLTELLYRIDPKPEYMDYFENVLYNHILGSQDAEGHKTYYIDLTQGGHKTYRNDFECCVGTGMENPGRYYHMIYYKDVDTLFVNLFINSTVQWEEAGMTLTQSTEFPVKDTTTLTVDQASGEVRTICLRVPSWTEGMTVQVNGEPVDAAVENGYLAVTRAWAKGDTITCTMPMDYELYVSREGDNVVAFKYGPILLAGEVTTGVKSVVSESRDPADFIERTDADALRFTISSLQPGSASMVLKPFYEFVSEQHMVYWNLYTPEEYEEMGGSTEIPFEDRLQNETIDKVLPGDGASESSHNLQVTGSSATGYFAPGGGSWRDTAGVASFSYDLAVEPTKANYLMCQFWGGDGPDGDKTRTFDILVNGQVIAKDYTLNNNRPNEILYQYYLLDSSLISGQETVTVTFRSNSENTKAGGVFGVRITRSEVYPDGYVEEPAVDVEGVTLDRTELTMQEGETARLTATVLPDDATNQNVTWTTSDETIATVQDGAVTAVAEGTADITVATEDGGYTAVCKVTVKKQNEAVCTADAAIRVEGQRDKEGNAVFHVTLRDASNVAAVQVNYNAESVVSITGENGFTYVPAGTEDGIMVLCYALEGDSKGQTFSCDEETVVATITVSGAKPTVQLDEVLIAAYDGADGQPAYGEPVELIEDTATFRGYDVDGSGEVDLLDVVAAMKFYQVKKTDGEIWETAQIADVNGDEKVDLEDLICIVLQIAR